MKKFFAALSLSLVSATVMAQAQVQVKDAWVRATVPAQDSTGAYMQLMSSRDARLVEARTPVAGIVELHEMKMEGDVMRMRPVAAIDMPAGKGASLAPGGYHVMLMKLKHPMKAGDKVPLTLVVEGADRKRQTVQVEAVVRPIDAMGTDNASTASAMPMRH